VQSNDSIERAWLALGAILSGRAHTTSRTGASVDGEVADDPS